MKPPTVFLSHNRGDNRFARRLGERLRQNGVTVWIDEAEIKVGDSLLERISEGLLGADHLAVILSPTSVTSPWVKRELEIATTREIEGRRIKVLPILYRDCDIPVFLQGKLYADFRNRRMYQHSLAKLLDALLPSGFAAGILETVRAAASAEFHAYSRLPRVDARVLSRYFTDGSARRRIIHLLKRHAERGWVISNPGNPSAFEMIDCRLKQIEGDRATVVTEEYWYLRWYEPQSEKYRFIYNHKNRQTYVLTRGKREWRVDVNIYPGPEHFG